MAAYLTCINACPANALLLTRLGVAAHARGKLVETGAAFVKAAAFGKRCPRPSSGGAALL